LNNAYSNKSGVEIEERKLTVVPIETEGLTSAEVSWFAPLCSDDFRYLGVIESGLQSNWQNTSKNSSNVRSPYGRAVNLQHYFV